MERDETGQYQAKVPEQDVIDAVEQHSPAATAEVGKALGVSRQAADYRLRKLREQGRIESKKIGPSLVWTVAAESDGERDMNTREDTADVSPSEPAESDIWPVVDTVATEQWDDTPERLEQRKAAARAVLEYAREQGEVSKKEAQSKLYPDNEVENQDKRTWWRKTVKPILKEVAEYDNSARAYRLTETNE